MTIARILNINRRRRQAQIEDHFFNRLLRLDRNRGAVLSCPALFKNRPSRPAA